LASPRFERRPVPISPGNLVTATPLLPEGGLPVLVTPNARGVDLLEWAAGRREEIDGLLRRYRALLFRDFDRQRAAQFADFVRLTSTGEPLEYVDRTTPRESLGDGLYSSTTYPARLSINLHNEGTYWMQWPLKLYFCCVTAPGGGGETPLASTLNVLQRLPHGLRSRFQEHGFLLERNYNHGLGLPWQEVFQTSEPQGVERYCHEHDITYEWIDGDRLRTRQVRPAIRPHPWTGEDVWFNHAAFFHSASYDAELLAMLEDQVGREGLPYRTSYGDGTEIDDEDVACIQAAYAAERRVFAWQVGDILLLDNMAVAHGREPYQGDRLVAVAMKEPFGGDVG
jgi:alpha-ketoglutarate-dependent taurine dioxygenase